MKTVKSLKDITTLEVGDKVVFGDLEYVVRKNSRNRSIQYYLSACIGHNNTIFEILNLQKRDFVEKLGIIADSTCYYDFPETKSLEVLTAIVSALFKEYEKQNELPKTWEEFCDNYPVTNKEAILSHNSVIITFEDFPNPSTERDPDVDRNFCTSLKEAEAFLAFMQLRQLRKAYVKNWEPDWNIPEIKYVIKIIGGNCFQIIEKDFEISPLSFPTYKLAQQFITNFKDLLEIAKPLL